MEKVHDVVAKIMDRDIVVNEFELYSHYYVHFRTKTLGKDTTPFTPPSYRLNSTNIVLL